MADTTNYGWHLPTVNADADVWGTKSNAIFIAIDSVVFGKFDKAGGTLTGGLVTAASATGGAGLNLPHGVAPTSPVNGDEWTTTAGAFARINGATKSFAFLEGAAFTGAVSVASTLTLAADPVSGLQAATKQYVDSVATGLQIKNAAALATTANITLSGEQTIDGTLTSTSRVLVKDQTAPAEDGLYTTGAGSWTRATDMDAWSEVTGALVFISGGSTNAGKRYYCTATAGGTLNTTAINFVLYDTVTSYTGSGGVTLSGSDFRLSNMATQTFKGRTTAGTGAPEDLTATQATAILNPMVGDSGSGGTKGLVPAPAMGEAPFALMGDGTFSGLTLVAAGRGVNIGSSMSFSGATGIAGFTRTANGKWKLTLDDTMDSSGGWVPVVTALYSGSTMLFGCEDSGGGVRSTTEAYFQFRTGGNTLQDPEGVNVLVWGKKA